MQQISTFSALESLSNSVSILPGVKIFARKKIFATPSIDVAVKDRRKVQRTFRNFVKQNSIHINYNTNLQKRQSL